MPSMFVIYETQHRVYMPEVNAYDQCSQVLQCYKCKSLSHMQQFSCETQHATTTKWCTSMSAVYTQNYKPRVADTHRQLESRHIKSSSLPTVLYNDPLCAAPRRLCMSVQYGSIYVQWPYSSKKWRLLLPHMTRGPVLRLKKVNSNATRSQDHWMYMHTTVGMITIARRLTVIPSL